MGPAEGKGRGRGGGSVEEGFDVGDARERLFDVFAFVGADAAGADVDERDGHEVGGGFIGGDPDYFEGRWGRWGRHVRLIRLDGYLWQDNVYDRSTDAGAGRSAIKCCSVV